MGEELSRLLADGFVKEVKHPYWIVNPVLVQKKNGKWQMSVDYTSLNQACPKDPLPLPRIKRGVDLTTRCELLSILIAYYGYHQIPLVEEDQHATTFITPLWMLLLCKNVVRVKECRGNLPTVYAVLFQRANWAQSRGTHRQHCHEDPAEWQSHR
jgi:hypothetical protein